MFTVHDRYPNLRLCGHPWVQSKLTRVRDAATPPREFRRLLAEIAGLMTADATAGLAVVECEVETPLERTRGPSPAQPLTVVPILRAGLAMAEGVLALLPEARVGHIGLRRDEDALEPVEYFSKLPPDVAQGPVLLVDPMVATGGSAAFAATRLREAGCRDVRLLCLVCAPPGIERLRETHPDLTVFAAALDRQLDARGYILPGLGDAGDRAFGTP